MFRHQRRKTRMKLLLLLISLSLPALVFAVNADKSLPMKINADSTVYNREKGVATFLGHVVIDQGSTHVQGDKVVLHFNEQHQLKEAIVYGKPAKVQTLPNGQKAILHARAETIYYYPLKHQIVLIKNAWAEQAGNVLQGPTLTYNTETQVIETSATHRDRGRTTIILQPKTTKKVQNKPTGQAKPSVSSSEGKKP